MVTCCNHVSSANDKTENWMLFWSHGGFSGNGEEIYDAMLSDNNRQHSSCIRSEFPIFIAHTRSKEGR